MLEQVLTQAMSYVQLITAALLLFVVVLEFIHVLQMRRMNKKLGYAGYRLLQYLKVVFDEGEQDHAEEEVDGNGEMQVTLLQQQLKSRQEEDMRISLEHKKQKKDEELLDTVLQEIFD